MASSRNSPPPPHAPHDGPSQAPAPARAPLGASSTSAPHAHRRRPNRGEGALSPVLLIGAGTGEATCGILYLASALRRQGLEAFVRLVDDDDSDEALAATLEALLNRVRPRLVGISLKWFHHLARAFTVAQVLKRVDPEVQVVVGGNTAAHFWREVAAWPCVDHLVLGDGEAPLLALCRGVVSPPNVVSRAADGSLHRPALTFVQGQATGAGPGSGRDSGCGSSSSGDELELDVAYHSRFDELFLSELDLASFSGWVAPGKGCAENCVYCGGGRGPQRAQFGRARPFLRSEASVRRDLQAIVPYTWQLRYDFAGSSTEFLRGAWRDLDLSRHAVTYFLWGLPPRALVEALTATFRRVFLVLDVGCFSESQRQSLTSLGLLKPCPTDEALLQALDALPRSPELELEISGIGGLPLTSSTTLDEERRFVDRLLERDCLVGYQRLQAQPGALVTEHPERFAMETEARTYAQFYDFFAQPPERLGDRLPMVTFTDARLEREVQRAARRIEAAVAQRAAARGPPRVTSRTRLVQAAASRRELELGAWLGSHRVPARLARTRITVLRSRDGTGLACAPSLPAHGFVDPALQQGEDAAALLAALSAFERPTAVAAALRELAARGAVDVDTASELIGQLAATRFLELA